MCFACGPAVAIVGTFPLWYISIIRMVRAIKAHPAPGRFPPFPPQAASVQKGDQ